MYRIKTFLMRLRIAAMFGIAILLILFLPFLFIMLDSGIIKKIGEKIPLKEGIFSTQSGSLKLLKPGQ